MHRLLAWTLIALAVGSLWTAITGAFAYGSTQQLVDAPIYVAEANPPAAGAEPKPLLYCSAPASLTMGRNQTVNFDLTCFNNFLSVMTLDLTFLIKGGNVNPPSVSLGGWTGLPIMPVDTEILSLSVSTGALTPGGSYQLEISGSTPAGLSDIEVSFTYDIPITVQP